MSTQHPLLSGDSVLVNPSTETCELNLSHKVRLGRRPPLLVTMACVVGSAPTSQDFRSSSIDKKAPSMSAATSVEPTSVLTASALIMPCSNWRQYDICKRSE